MKKISTYHIGVLENMDATEAAEKIQSKEISSQEVVICAIERAKIANEVLNAIVHPDYKRALDISKNLNPGIFSGVPTFIKDLNDVEGLPTLKGCNGYKAKPAKKNDKIVDQLLATTGSVILGKSSTSEYGLLPCGESLQNGITRNPWNTGHCSGGSSAGSAALVAAGVVPFAHASDGGGSIRIPASCCGLVGLKPSRGRNIISHTSVLPVDIAQDGIVSRTVRDTANFYAALERYYSNPNLPAIGHVRHAAKKRLRIGMFTKSSAGVESHSDVIHTVIETGKLCEQLGHEITYINNPFEHSIAKDFILYWSFLSYVLIFPEYAKHGFSFNHFKMTKFARELRSWFPLLSVKAIKSINNLKHHIHSYNGLFEKYDILLSPTLSHPAPPVGHFGTETDTIDIILRLNNYVNFTTTQNITGAPAISLPLGLSKDGLPIGVQLAAMTGQERILLEFSFELEEAKQFTLLTREEVIL